MGDEKLRRSVCFVFLYGKMEMKGRGKLFNYIGIPSCCFAAFALIIFLLLFLFLFLLCFALL